MGKKRNKPRFLLLSCTLLSLLLTFGGGKMYAEDGRLANTVETVEAAEYFAASSKIEADRIWSPSDVSEAEESVSLPSVSQQGIGQDEASAPVAIEYDSLFSTLAILVGVLLLVVLLLVFISANLVNLVRIRDGKEPFTLAATFAQTKKMALDPFVAVGGNLVVVIIASLIVVPQARSVGYQQGYAPDQPIKFSHKLHAGQYEVDCKYCHTGTVKGKNAWIPSVNVCMNCHKGVQEGPKYGKEEIAKVRLAYEENMPIEWVRIHNLPDLVYFNHQQHVVVGNLECQTCHGPVEEMEKVYQWAPLSMGWCINCHRETEVDKKLYESLGRPDVEVVADIGGINCARCHY